MAEDATLGSSPPLHVLIHNPVCIPWEVFWKPQI